MERAELLAVGLAAIDGKHVHLGEVCGKAAERLTDLERELTGRRNHEGLGYALAGNDARQDRQRERGRLAGTGLREADDVAPVEQHGDSGGLNGGGGLVAEVLHGTQHAGVEAERVKAGALRFGGGSGHHCGGLGSVNMRFHRTGPGFSTQVGGIVALCRRGVLRRSH